MLLCGLCGGRNTRMPDERYAPPKAAVRDMNQERAMQARPWEVKAAIWLIALSWLTDLPVAWDLYTRGTDALLLVGIEALGLGVVWVLCRAIARGVGWGRMLYLLLSLVLLYFTISGREALEEAAGYAAFFTLCSAALGLAALPLLFLGSAGAWFRMQRG